MPEPLSLSQRIVQVALSQVGERERASNVTRYHDWYDAFGSYGYLGQPWCAIFVCWVLDQAGARLPTIQGSEYGQYPGAAKVSYLRDWFGWEAWTVLPPCPGDVAFHTWSHIGIVVATFPGHVVTVEGNASDCGHTPSDRVALRVRPLSDFVSFARVPENYSPG